MSGKTVFVVGAGFIGREVLDLLLAEGYQVTALARREEAATELEQSGAKARMGSLDDDSVITDQTSKSDIVFHIADADHTASVKAILAGVEQRASQGKKTIYIHTSGTGVLDDDSRSEYKSDQIYYDDQPDGINSISDSAPHRNVDLSILEVRKRLGAAAKMAIMTPPLIYGYNPKHGRQSIQVPALIRFALKQGYAGYVGKGEAVWGQIHVKDLARAYLVLLHWMEQTDAAKVLENPYFFAENGVEFSWAQVSADIGKALHAAGRLPSPEAKSIPAEELEHLFGDPVSYLVVGSNARHRANRLRALGWTPREKGRYESLVEDELAAYLA